MIIGDAQLKWTAFYLPNKKNDVVFFLCENVVIFMKMIIGK
jgi:hypothetical protein